MAKEGKTALVFGASGTVGWGVVNELLSSYPAPGTVQKVIAVTNRPLDFKDTFWPEESPSRQTLSLVSGVDLVSGTVQTPVKGISEVTHVFYFVYKSECDITEEIEVNRKMLETALSALDRLSPKLEMIVFPTGTKAYGIHLGGTVFPPPYDESMSPSHEKIRKTVHYQMMHEVLQKASADKQWTYCDIRPDVVVGFAPNGSPMNLATHWATYLSLYATVEGKGASIPFPGTTKVYKALYNEGSSEIIAKCAIWAALHPQQMGQEHVFNIADQAKPESMRERWPALASYFGLKGVAPPDGDEGGGKPGEYIDKHKAELKKVGIEADPVGRSAFLDGYGYFADFDRQMSLEKVRAAGFDEELDPNESWFKVWDRLKKAGTIPS
ncbi:MAG: hypothetical protein Q9183_002864 [Haloplaca sp. 2 TL-2023]